MKKNKDITEIDIFNLVFFSDTVREEDRKLIESNKEYYELIEFYKKQKEEIEKSLQNKTKKKLAALIPAYKLTAEQ